MTEAMPFLQKAILLSHAPRPLPRAFFFSKANTRRRVRFQQFLSV